MAVFAELGTNKKNVPRDSPEFEYQGRVFSSLSSLALMDLEQRLRFLDVHGPGADISTALVGQSFLEGSRTTHEQEAVDLVNTVPHASTTLNFGTYLKLSKSLITTDFRPRPGLCQT